MLRTKRNRGDPGGLARDTAAKSISAEAKRGTAVPMVVDLSRPDSVQGFAERVLQVSVAHTTALVTPNISIFGLKCFKIWVSKPDSPSSPLIYEF